MHWSEIGPNPNAPPVKSFLRRELLAKRRGRIADVSSFLLDFVGGKDVLDIAVVQHDIA